MLLNSSRFLKVYGALCSVYFFCGLTGTLASPVAAADYRQQLVEQAASMAIASSREWDVLLHYRHQGGQQESIIDDRRFFLAPTGKTDPAAELAATITGLFADAATGDEHPRCRFPARYEFLQQRLGIDSSRLPNPVCAKLDESLKAVDPRSAVLVFPAAHNNGPASMFGHTLLRVGSSYQSELLSHAVNYAAHSSDTNGILFAFKGIFGFYPGYFSILPYYEKVKEYNDLEHRDVWEYGLKLTPDEVRRMVLHIWELQGISSEYYFFDENCSFMLLSLLEAARPELRLSQEYWDRWSFWVIPADTIATVRRAGLIDRVSYRPSLATRILHRASLLPAAARETAFAIATKQLPATAEAGSAAVTLEERRQVLDLATEYLQYRFSRNMLAKQEFQSQFLPILQARSGLGIGDKTAGEVLVPPQPEEGHLPAKITTGAGVRRDRPYLELAWQPAYHDLMDPDAGYTKGAQIDFFALSGRYYPLEQSFKLQSFRPVDILSLAPRDLFFKPYSWKVNGGLDRKSFADGSDRLYLHLNTGGGMAWHLTRSGNSIGYVMAEADINLADRFQQKAALGGGGSAGLLTSLSDSWKAHLYSSALFYVIEEHQQYRLTLDQHVNLSKNSGLLLNALWERSFNNSRAEAKLSWVRYF
jgi:hypothetical protein